MYTRIFSALPLPLAGDILGVSGLKYWRGSPHYTPPVKVIADDARITEADYPEVDMCSLPYADNTFDWVISDCVLEHVEGNIQTAVDEARRVLKTGGTAIFTTAFIFPIHWGPQDLWRCSPGALRYLCRDFSEITQCEGWGNRWAHVLMFLYDPARDWRIPDRRLSFRRWLATYNERRYPLMTWIVAKK